MADLIGLIYAGFVVFGGVFGYVKAGSSMSLISSLVFGTSALVGSYLNSHLILLLTSGSLATMMGTRFYNSGKLMPAGIVALFSVAIAVRSAMRLLNY